MMVTTTGEIPSAVTVISAVLEVGEVFPEYVMDMIPFPDPGVETQHHA